MSPQLHAYIYISLAYPQPLERAETTEAAFRNKPTDIAQARG
jgi:hypothetical protein